MNKIGDIHDPIKRNRDSKELYKYSGFLNMEPRQTGRFVYLTAKRNPGL